MIQKFNDFPPKRRDSTTFRKDSMIAWVDSPAFAALLRGSPAVRDK
jgi:hypothetical protein